MFKSIKNELKTIFDSIKTNQTAIIAKGEISVTYNVSDWSLRSFAQKVEVLTAYIDNGLKIASYDDCDDLLILKK